MSGLAGEIGERTHAEWKAWRVRQGYPDHEYVRVTHHDGSNGVYYDCGVCRRDMSAHHEDMVPWADLPEAKREQYRVQEQAGIDRERARIKAEALAGAEEWWEKKGIEEVFRAIEQAIPEDPDAAYRKNALTIAGAGYRLGFRDATARAAAVVETARIVPDAVTEAIAEVRSWPNGPADPVKRERYDAELDTLQELANALKAALAEVQP